MVIDANIWLRVVLEVIGVLSIGGTFDIVPLDISSPTLLTTPDIRPLLTLLFKI